MKKVLRNLVAVAAIAACAFASVADASVVVAGTRVVFPAKEREVTIKVTNVGTTTALVQAWLDTGDAGASPDRIDVPFTLTPAMFRLDPTKGQTMRLIYTKAPLAEDKETLFWLNVLEIPPKPKAGAEATEAADGADGANQLQMAFRTRIKVMFRPTGLPGKADEAPGQVQWEVTHTPDGYRLKATNPTPYHVNLGSVALVSGGETLDAGSGFVKPGGSEEFAVTGLKGAPKAGAQVRYRALNDYGAGVVGEAQLK